MFAKITFFIALFSTISLTIAIPNARPEVDMSALHRILARADCTQGAAICSGPDMLVCGANGVWQKAGCDPGCTCDVDAEAGPMVVKCFCQ